MSATRTKLTPPELAAQWGIGTNKVLTWIASGELRAVNAATRIGGRPRWLIDVADIEVFESRRSATPPPRPVRRKRKTANVIEFF